MRRVAGLDLSLAGTAAVVLDDDGRVSAALAFSPIMRDRSAAPPWLELHRSTSVASGDAAGDFARTAGVAEAVRVFLRRHLPTGSIVGIEDHAFGARGRAIYQLGHLHGMVRRDVVSSLSCRFQLLGVGEIKLAATGRGNATKLDVVNAVGHLALGSLSRQCREAIADAYSVARLAFHLERLRSGRATIAALPGDLARLVARGDLIDRPLIG